MEEKKAPVTYTVTINGSDGTSDSWETTSLILLLKEGEDEEGIFLRTRRILQGKKEEFYTLYKGVCNEKENLEKDYPEFGLMNCFKRLLMEIKDIHQGGCEDEQ